MCAVHQDDLPAMDQVHQVHVEAAGGGEQDPIESSTSAQMDNALLPHSSMLPRIDAHFTLEGVSKSAIHTAAPGQFASDGVTGQQRFTANRESKRTPESAKKLRKRQAMWAKAAAAHGVQPIASKVAFISSYCFQLALRWFRPHNIVIALDQRLLYTRHTDVFTLVWRKHRERRAAVR